MFKGLVFVDCIIRFEQLQNDWDYVSKRIGVPSELPHLKGTKHTHYTDYYDDESIRIIGDLYKTEIEALGYKFGEN
jgi:hypothetical protein